MNNKDFTISRDAEQDLVNLFETKYFRALQELVDEELDITKTHMLDKNLSADNLRFYQGRAEGLGIVLLRIQMIHDAAMKEAKSQ